MHSKSKFALKPSSSVIESIESLRFKIRLLLFVLVGKDLFSKHDKRLFSDLRKLQFLLYLADFERGVSN